jgi:hypothetical protein
MAAAVALSSIKLFASNCTSNIALVAGNQDRDKDRYNGTNRLNPCGEHFPLSFCDSIPITRDHFHFFILTSSPRSLRASEKSGTANFHFRYKTFHKR